LQKPAKNRGVPAVLSIHALNAREERARGGSMMTRGRRSRGCLCAALAAVVLGLSAAPAIADDPGTVVVASFGSPWQEALEKAMAAFESEHKVKIRYTAGSSADNVARAVAARTRPEVDVVMGEEMTFGLGRQEGIFEKLDPAKVPNLKAIVPEARAFGEEGVGVIMQAIGMFYRTDVFERNKWAPPTSWSDLVDKRYCHRVDFNDPNVSYGYYVLMMLGGGKPDDVPAGIKRLVGYRDCVDTLDPSAAKTVEKTQLGEYDVGVLTHYLVMNLAQRGVPVRFFNPKEGSVLQFTTAAVTKNAPHPDLAQAVVNEILSVRVQQQLVEQFNVSPVNPGAPISPDLIAAGAPDPKHLAEGGYVGVDAPAILPKRKQNIQDAVRAMAQ
jgi:putative spermidine/putrescine transport system substrate-binding protein